MLSCDPEYKNRVINRMPLFGNGGIKKEKRENTAALSGNIFATMND